MIKREIYMSKVRPFMDKDLDPKYVLSMDRFDMGRQGVLHRYIPDFLLKGQL